ncbi:CCA tRNA nucleotidyltransferase [Paenibacillus athensensis]|uniref:CCA tRNA nucleotidyltransferase n=1 Tax=Paenibacillus athensensis TaxID=1967502 RepID=A0A4Y8Q854_9BACL|nr:CCA tRNA nucleotidyltransferase [Paenibacillus athensensis]
MKQDERSALDDSGALLVLQQLEAAGYEAYLVGGCVRDYVLGRPIKDVDITTSARPEQVMAVFARTAPTGLAHGTVTVILPEGVYEVTTFRAEAEYTDHRRPASVAYISDLNEDLKRRDFTMNAMALSARGELLDPFGGRADAAAGLLRCVGQASERFGEDALRMLRCVRFAAAYGLRVEEQTWQALLAQAPLLRHVAMERVRSELERMVEGVAPARALRLLLASGLWQHVKRPLELPLERWRARDAALEGVALLAQQQERWALLLLLLETPAAEVRAALQRLTFARADAEAIVAVLGLAEQQAGACGGAGAAADDGGAPPGGAAGADPRELARVWKGAAVQYGARAAYALLAVLQALEASGGVLDAPPDARAGERAAAPPAVPLAAPPSPLPAAPLAAPSSPPPAVPLAAPPSPPPAPAVPPSAAAPPAPWLAGWLRRCGPLLRAHGATWLREVPCFSVKELAVSGTDVAERLGRRPGPWLGRLLETLLLRTALGELPNERTPLLEAATELGYSDGEP